MPPYNWVLFHVHIGSLKQTYSVCPATYIMEFQTILCVPPFYHSLWRQPVELIDPKHF